VKPSSLSAGLVTGGDCAAFELAWVVDGGGAFDAPFVAARRPSDSFHSRSRSSSNPTMSLFV
jgi:hypothetical protein